MTIKVIAASVGNCWALQNGSLILLSLHHHLAIPVSRRRPLGARLPESTPEWRRDNSEASRMCDPFCKAQQFPMDAAISLMTIWYFRGLYCFQSSDTNLMSYAICILPLTTKAKLGGVAPMAVAISTLHGLNDL